MLHFSAAAEKLKKQLEQNGTGDIKPGQWQELSGPSPFTNVDSVLKKDQDDAGNKEQLSSKGQSTKDEAIKERSEL